MPAVPKWLDRILGERPPSRLARLLSRHEELAWALFGLAGRRQAAVSLLAVAGLVWLGFQAPMWWMWVALTFVIGRGGWSHPSVVVPDRTITRAGRIIGVLCVLVFILTFVPVPFAG